MKYKPIEKEIFHVHTYRCGHASADLDEDYVLAAIENDAKRIVFTDHGPFPDNPFGSRMQMNELQDYVESIHGLKEKYKDKIQVLCGLEIEFLPQYMEYYKKLKASEKIDLLVLGQHMYMHESGTYNFFDKDRSGEYEGISKAMIEGMDTGLFSVLAHPDRMYMRYGRVDDKVREAINAVIAGAKRNGVLLEKNFGSMYKEHNFSEDFWTDVEEENVIYGFNAHSPEDISKYIQMGRK